MKGIFPQVFNIRDCRHDSSAVYIGRCTPYGNPYVIGRDGDRDQVCDKFEVYVLSNQKLLEQIKRELVGRDLLCHCKPLRCHGDFLLKIANEDMENGTY